jgi:predicted cupin superfamily sugar epimerase
MAVNREQLLTERAATLVATLGLMPHPEGGYYGEIYRSDATVLPGDGRGPRAALTTIYFLLPAGAVSRWHRVQSDEVWHFYEGAPLDLWMASPEGDRMSHRRLAPLDGEQRPVWTVPAGWWQAARSTGSYTLVGCSVGPGFDYLDFALAGEEPSAAAALRARHPDLAELL